MPSAARPISERIPALAMGAGLVAINAAAWGWAWAEFAGKPVLLGTAFLAYGFGLRHAVDADHIAAIDNATRKLIETGRSASGAGFFFSLGHATVVVLAVLVIALTSSRLPSSVEALAGILGTGISAASLFALAVANTLILISVYRLFAARKRGEATDDASLARLLAQRGLLGRLLRGLFRLISRSWHMYPLGFLFGLGFDTATEIGLLAVSAAQAAQGLPLQAIMVFPALFATGMALVDSLDGVLMAGAYRWAAIEPLRKLYYNLAVTTVSVIVAVAIGGIEVLGLLTGDAEPTGAFWSAIGLLNDHFGTIGAMIIALFAIVWAASIIYWRRRSTPAG